MGSRDLATARGIIAWLSLWLCLTWSASLAAGEPRSSGILDRLLAHPLVDDLGLECEGWLEQGFTWNPDSPADRFNGPVSQNDRANEYQLNQLYLIARRPTDSSCDRLSCGFQTDLVYGTDAFFFSALGWDDRIVSDSKSRFYKLALPQAYAEVYAPIGTGVTFQIGKWYALVGYESGLPPVDFFYSKTIGFNITPYSHTGVLASFNLGNRWSMSHGVHRGSDVWEDNNENLAYTGSVTWTSEDKATSWIFAINVGPEQDEGANFQDIDGAPGPDAPGENLNRVLYSLTLERQLGQRLTYVINHDYFFQEGSATYGIENAEAYGATQYLIYEYSDRLMLGSRLEIYRDDDGFVASGFRSGNAAAPGIYTNLTLGMQYKICDRLMVRPEIRWDWQSRDDPTDTPAFDDGTSSRQFLAAADVVLVF